MSVQRIHSIPVGDLELHAAQETCWCHPTETAPAVWVHNAKDCRESRERVTGEKCSAGWINIAEVVKLTPDSKLPPIGDPPRRKMIVEIAVSSDFEKRLDNQWMVEREINADRWSWQWKDSDRLAQLNYENAKLKAALYQVEFPSCLVCFRRYPLGHADDCAIGKALASPAAVPMVPREDAEALVAALETIETMQGYDNPIGDRIYVAEKAVAAFRVKHPKASTSST